MLEEQLTIYIPTYKRAAKQITLKNLPAEFKKRSVNLVVRPEEFSEHLTRYGEQCKEIVRLPEGLTTKSAALEWLIKERTKTNYIMFLDDDLVFHVRKTRGDWHLRLMNTEEDFYEMINALLQKAKDEQLAHVAVSMRKGNNVCLGDWAYNVRYMRATVYDRKKLINLGIEISRLGMMEDFDIALQLIRKGCKSAINYHYCQDELQFNAPGGMQEERLKDNLGEGFSLKLAELHPGFVKIKQKKTKTFEGADVTIFWKKAYESSKRFITDECPPAEVLHAD